MLYVLTGLFPGKLNIKSYSIFKKNGLNSPGP